ncbi:glycerol-3-phosphate dehydrogenase [Sandarakinorhabdus rubra]|uniref:glycerol-3-phosphate dehydrogenase n=1 Tax=Sandarakinorhabdus rubra TaxID=2672568 RepID=UPI0013DAC5AC|nr:glycerol-3-phosphate dehydrogenase [Sandarakinorhabdus rubra]
MSAGETLFDVAIIGAGINGAGIARDAAGRGLSVVILDAGDVGGATSSASTKLIHGGLRYLEFFAFGLVRKALAEREVLLDIAPHISWPQPFVLPHAAGMRPVWQLRLATLLYDHLARRVVVPGSERIDLRATRAGRALKPDYRTAFRYWDGWVDDARLVVENLKDAAARGALVLPRTTVSRADRRDGQWQLICGDGRRLAARQLVNAAGPWAGEVAQRVMGLNDAPQLKLVQGSHIVTRRVHLGRDAFMLQQPDGRIIFVLPYERDFSLIGTTETDVQAPGAASVTDGEVEYLLAAANRYLVRPLTAEDVVHRFAGVRPLVLEPGKGDRETSRDYHLVSHAGLDALSVVGGKITTYRVLAEDVLRRISPKSKPWTASAPLPGGAFERLPGEHGQAGFKRWLDQLQAREHHYDPAIIRRLAHTIGADAEQLLAGGLGHNLGGVFEAELDYFRRREWAQTSGDVLWRRTKLGLHLDSAAQAEVARWFGETPSDLKDIPAGHRFARPGLG